MKEPASKTAVMIFSLRAKEEACRKPLFKKQRDSLKIYQSLLDQTALVTRDLDADIIWVYGNDQKGTDFASRFTHAFSQTYALGYDMVIAIGSDCPGLTKDHLNKAILQLRENEIVAGPAQDGGVYLLGMQRSYFNASAFALLPWQQDQLYAAILGQAYAKEASVFALSSLCDMDDIEDVFAFAKKKPSSAFARLVTQINTGKQAPFKQFKESKPSSSFAPFFSLRAPPLK